MTGPIYKRMINTWRGHDIYYDKKQNKWFYSDNSWVQDDPNRACGYCKLPNTPEGYDGCIGKLPSVMNACCGHGSNNDAYIQFDDGQILKDFLI